MLRLQPKVEVTGKVAVNIIIIMYIIIYIIRLQPNTEVDSMLTVKVAN